MPRSGLLKADDDDNNCSPGDVFYIVLHNPLLTPSASSINDTQRQPITKITQTKTCDLDNRAGSRVEAPLQQRLLPNPRGR